VSAVVWAWWASPDWDDEADAFPDSVERARLARLTSAGDRARFVTSRLLLKNLITASTGVPAAAVRLSYDCDECGKPHGRPRVAYPKTTLPWHVSITHCAERVVVAATQAGPVGVDVELVSATDFAGFEETVLTPQERREQAALPAKDRARGRAVSWTRKEAILKATGHGLTVDPRLIEATSEREHLSVINLAGYEETFVQFFDLSLGRTYRCAVAVLASGPVEIDLVEVLPPAPGGGPGQPRMGD
jgi:4'-phosphopantetheinyl transferase